MWSTLAARAFPKVNKVAHNVCNNDLGSLSMKTNAYSVPASLPLQGAIFLRILGGKIGRRCLGTTYAVGGSP